MRRTDIRLPLSPKAARPVGARPVSYQWFFEKTRSSTAARASLVTGLAI